MEEKVAAVEMERNWADLPPELFQAILEKLPDLCDFVRSRAVCKPWRLSSSVSDLPPQFPWILKSITGPDLEFYSITFNKEFTIRDPCSSGKNLFGHCYSAGGYLLTDQEGYSDSFSLLNPLNNTEIPLPVLHDWDPLWDNFAWFNPLSPQIDNYMFVSRRQRSFVCKLGGDRWEIIGPGHKKHQYCCYCYKGLLYRIKVQTGVTQIMDISSRKVLYVIPPPKDEKLPNMCFEGPFLVESLGEILSIFYNSNMMMDHKFYIHCLEFGNGKGNPRWVKLSSIGDQILFLEIPHFGRGFCLSVSDFPGFKGNCIYFIIELPAFRLGQVHAINIYDIETGETVCIDTPFSRKNIYITWFIPTLNHV